MSEETISESLWEAADKVLCSKEDALKNVATMARIAVSIGATWEEVQASIKNAFDKSWGDKWIEAENQK